jgi:hypothetical protein
MLSASAGTVNSGLTDLHVGRFVEALLDTGEITAENALVTTTPSMKARAGLRFAYGMNDLLGFMIEGDVAYGEAPQRGNPYRWFGMLGAVLDLDLTHRWNTPIGFGLGFRTRSNPTGPQGSGDYVQSYLARISYVGASDFDLGLELTYDFIPVRAFPEKVAFISGMIDMRLVF